jgi:hypothetical protein
LAVVLHRRAVFYRQEKGSLDDVAMAVVVQQMVDSDKSGCCSPSTRSTAAGTAWSSRPPAAWARPVVSGEVTPDNYTLSRDGVVKRSRVVGTEPVLSDAECAALARWDGGWPTCTEAPRTSSGRSTPTAGCSAAVASRHHDLRSGR